MSAIATAIVTSAFLGSKAAKSGAATQAAAAEKASDISQTQFEQTRADYAPWRAAGEQALNKLIPMADYKMFGPEQFSADPGYGFRLAEGQKALDRQAAARGGLISGGALKAATRYGQDMGSQEYNNAFNRYQIERNAQLAPLQSLAQLGQTSANQLGQFGAANAANVGNYLTGGAAAQAAGQMGAANVIGQGVGQYLNYTSNNNLLSALQNRGSTYGYTPTTNYSTGADYTLSGKLGQS